MSDERGVAGRGRVPSAASREPASGLRLRRQVLLGTAVAVVVAVPVLDRLAEDGLIAGATWTLVVLLALIGVSAAETMAPVGHGRAMLRLVVALGLLTAFCAVAGWSLVLPAVAVLVAVQHIRTSGSRLWRTAAAAVAAFTLLAQGAVATGLQPSVVDPAGSHLAAGWILAVSLLSIASVGTGVRHREQAADALARVEARLRALMESSTDVLTVSDAQGRLTYVSPAVERTLGHTADALIGSPLLSLVDAEHRPIVARRLAEVVRQGSDARLRFDVLVVHATHERRWYEWTAHNLLDDPLVEGLVVDQRDVTERLLHSKALAHAAAHDELTGLANRGELMRRLSSALPQASPGAGIAVLFLDLDKFKEVNDTFGHQAGDEVLTIIAERLEGCLRAQDHLARLGGDEFCVLLTEIRDTEEVRAIVGRLSRAVQLPIALGTTTVRVGVSIGASLAVDGSQDPTALFAGADAAMYVVKNGRRRLRGPRHSEPIAADEPETAGEERS